MGYTVLRRITQMEDPPTIECKPNGPYLVKDLGTRHGTWMGMRKVNDESLRAGDVIKIGSTRLAYFPAGQTARK